jgi:hypothetical protein
MTDTCFNLLNLPTIPFSAESSKNGDVAFRRIVPPNLGFKIKQLDGSVQSITSYEREFINMESRLWLLSIVPELKGHIKELSIQTITNSETNGLLAQLPVHNDGKRNEHCLSFFYETGGDDVYTAWWQEDGYDIYRNPNLYNENSDNVKADAPPNPNAYKLDLNGLTEINRTVMKNNSWALLKTKILHSVHNVKTKRIAFSAMFTNPELYDTIVQKYGI